MIYELEEKKLQGLTLKIVLSTVLGPTKRATNTSTESKAPMLARTGNRSNLVVWAESISFAYLRYLSSIVPSRVTLAIALIIFVVKIPVEFYLSDVVSAYKHRRPSAGNRLGADVAAVGPILKFTGLPLPQQFSTRLAQCYIWYNASCYILYFFLT